jgi:hypothetical protein
MRADRRHAFIDAVIIILTFGGSHVGAEPSVVTLSRDLQRLVDSGDVAILFTSAQQATLRTLLTRADRSEEIDRMLTSRAAIEVTINPEARVSARRTDAELPRMDCGVLAPILIRIANEAFVTSRVNASLRDASASRMVTIQPIQQRLVGAAVEYRVLKISLRQAGTTDVTLTFDAGPGTEDLGSRATVYFIANCRPR